MLTNSHAQFSNRAAAARVQLGNTPVQVSRFSFGGATLTHLSERDAQDLLHKAVQAGVTHIDTSPKYGLGKSENDIGKFLRSGGVARDKITISSKFGYDIVNGTEEVDKVLMDFSRDGILRAVDASLKRLGTDYLDIGFVHDPDQGISWWREPNPYRLSHFNKVLDQTYPTFVELKEQGVFRAIGVGMNGCEMLLDFARSQAIFDCFIAATRFSLITQEATQELLPLCKERGIAVLLASVFHNGFMHRAAGYHGLSETPPEVLAKREQVLKLCSQHNVNFEAASIQLALAQPAVASILVGVNSGEHLETDLRAFDLNVPPEFWQLLRQSGLISENVQLPG